MIRVAFLLLTFIINSSFSNSILQEHKRQQVYQGTISNSLVTIFKQTAGDTPYYLQAKNAKYERKFYVIQWKSDIFSYLMIEKKGNETYYYPLGWADLASITIKDLQQRSKDILNGKIPRVPKENL